MGVLTPSYFRDVLRAQSYKATPSRLAILKVLNRAKQPVTAHDIVKKIGRAHDQATVYRTIQTLLKIGVVKRIDFQHGATYYELSDVAEHHHVICTNCARVADVKDCCAVSMDAKALQQSGFSTITQHSLEFFGICTSCQA